MLYMSFVLSLAYLQLCVIYVTYLVALYALSICLFFFFFKQKTAYEMRISDWSSDVCSSDLPPDILARIEDSSLTAAGVVGNLAQRMQPRLQHEIGRASCRERVCQYV